MPRPPPTHDDEHWLARLDAHVALKLLGRRSFDIALASGMLYGEAPTLGQAGFVHAVLVEPGRGVGGAVDIQSRVAVRLRDDDSLAVECSRCMASFGPCRHGAALTVDLAIASALRAAVLAGESRFDPNEAVRAARRAMHLEASFEATLRAWTSPAEAGARVEIAVAPAPRDLLRGYGDRDDGPGISLTVRRAGERRLLAPQEIGALVLSASDRRVLRYARGTTGASGKKALVVFGVEASLTLAAIREHGGVFAHGYKSLLDIRAAFARPAIEESPVTSGGSGRALGATWIADGARVAMESSFFFTGPFAFVWVKDGPLYRVAPDVDVDMAAELVRAPTLIVPRAKLEDAGQKLVRAARPRGIVVPRTERFGLPPLEAPRFVLRLAGDPLEVMGALVAVYPHGEAPLFGEHVTQAVPPRDDVAESRARAHVIAAGLVHHAGTDDGAPTEEWVGAVDEGAIALWQTGLPLLRAATDPPIEVELTERLAQVRVGAAIAPRVHVALEGNWLDTRVEFWAREIPVEMDAIRAALRKKHRWVSLTDGTLARITGTVARLVDEAAEVLGDDDHALLPAHQLGRLERWIEENDGRVDAAVASLRKRLRALAVSPEPALPKKLKTKLRPYQKSGLAWLQFLRAMGAGGLLADDMGLGKTVTTLAFLQRWKEDDGAKPSLVVCPTSVATNWVHEAKRFTPSLSVALLHGTPRERAKVDLDGSDLVVTTYGVLRQDKGVLAARRFRAVILDEAQWVKNADALARRAAGELDADMRIALTGTPVENRLRELWSIVSFVNPGILGTESAFERRYERSLAMNLDSPLGPELRSIVRPFLLRRTKAEVLSDLPPKTEIDRFVTLSRENKRLYDALAHTLRASIARAVERRDGGAGQLSVFTALTRLRQMACDPRLVDPSQSPSASAKREAFLELVRELVSEKRRALVFSQFVELFNLWRKDLDAVGIRYEYLDGSTRKRDVVVRNFQEGDAPLFLVSLKAGGAGLNLTAADTVIHCDPWWNPAVEDQATDRAHRIGQDKPVTVVRLLAAGTIEEKILSLKAKKRGLVETVLEDGAGALAGLDEATLRVLFGDVDGPSWDDGASLHSAADVLATDTDIVDPKFAHLVEGAQRWLTSTGSPSSELAWLLDLPEEFAERLARGRPFPCSRVVAERIERRLEAFRRGMLHGPYEAS